MTSNGYASCIYCGDPIDPTESPSPWQAIKVLDRVKGVRASGKNGGSDVKRLGIRFDEFAHDHCVQLVAMGIDPSHPSLFEEPKAT